MRTEAVRAFEGKEGSRWIWTQAPLRSEAQGTVYSAKAQSTQAIILGRAAGARRIAMAAIMPRLPRRIPKNPASSEFRPGIHS